MSFISIYCFSNVLAIVNKKKSRKYSRMRIRSFYLALSLAVSFRARYDTRTMAAAPRRDNRLYCLPFVTLSPSAAVMTAQLIAPKLLELFVSINCVKIFFFYVVNRCTRKR